MNNSPTGDSTQTWLTLQKLSLEDLTYLCDYAGIGLKHYTKDELVSRIMTQLEK